MKPEYTVTDESFTSPGTLSLPHFDDETTLLSARPVVPLTLVQGKAVKPGRALKQIWRFSLAIVVAVALGALGATLFYTQRRPTSTGAQAGSATGSSAEDSSQVNDMRGVVGSANAMIPTPERKTVQVIRDRSQTSVRHSGTEMSRHSSKPAKLEAIEKRDVVSPDEYEREIRRERREARRLRRQAERESRRKERSADDLFRIREIFEGSPRP